MAMKGLSNSNLDVKGDITTHSRLNLLSIDITIISHLLSSDRLKISWKLLYEDVTQGFGSKLAQIKNGERYKTRYLKKGIFLPNEQK